MKKSRILFLGFLATLVSCENENQSNDYPSRNVVLNSNEILNEWIDEALREQPLTKSSTPVKTVDFVAVDRYTGRWFELANFPSPFNQNCSCTTADYAALPNGVSVLNNCTSTITGEFNTISGNAVVVDPQSNAKLQVFLDGIPFPSDYWIIDLVAFDPNEPYDFAVVSGPTRRSLFILSRKPVVNTLKQKIAVIKILINLIKQGYDIRTIEISPQFEDCEYL